VSRDNEDCKWNLIFVDEADIPQPSGLPPMKITNILLGCKNCGDVKPLGIPGRCASKVNNFFSSKASIKILKTEKQDA